MANLQITNFFFYLRKNRGLLREREDGDALTMYREYTTVARERDTETGRRKWEAEMITVMTMALAL